MKFLKKIPAYLQILIGLTAGICWGFFIHQFDLNPYFTIAYIKPLGTLFINGLKMIAMPLVFASLIVGIAQVSDLSKLSRLGGKTVLIYIVTTLIALTIGIGAVSLLQPGSRLSDESKSKLMTSSMSSPQVLSSKEAPTIMDTLVGMVPENIILSASENRNMLQIVFVALVFGIAIVQIGQDKTKGFLSFCEGLNHIILQVIDYIMWFAPIGVFALMAAIIVEVNDIELIYALGGYSVTVIVALFLMILFYLLVLSFVKKINPFDFLKHLRPALLLAFSTSSSAATLPVTMQCCKENLKLSDQSTGFVLPLGATINMDGTSIYQAVATVFIAQLLQIDLSFAQLSTIVFTALLASIGTAGVPGVGIVMLAIVLESVKLPLEYIALILAPDRILDMCRTVVNVCGDAMVATLVDEKEV